MQINLDLKNRAGRLTRYGLSCGYLETKEVGDVVITMWQEGGPLVHVRAHDFSIGKRLSWESFEKLNDARKYFDKLVKGHKIYYEN